MQLQGQRLLSAKFGPTAHNHEQLMPLFWGPLANLAIFLALYKYRKIWSWVHGAYFALATIIAISTSLPILFHTGLVSQDTIVTSRNMFGLRLHYLTGIVCLQSMVLAAGLGITTKLANILQKKSSLLLLIRKYHKFCGYLTVVLCKINIYIITWGGDFAGFFAFDLISACMLVFWKLRFPRIEAKPPSFEFQSIPRSIASISELNQGKDYIVFSNFVYEVQPLRINHPAGFQILAAVKNRQIDRYIYGSYTVDSLRGIPLWSHSYKFLTLLNEPIAEIDIPPTIQGLQAGQVQCQVLSLKKSFQKGEILIVSLIKKQGSPFKFLGITNVNQLGRYFALRCNQQTTRLYTVLNFLADQNLQFLSKYLRLPEYVSQERIVAIESQQQFQPRHELQRQLKPKIINKTSDITALKQVQLCQIDENTIKKRRRSISIMLKVYPGGKLTNLIARNALTSLHLSGPKGQGLKLGQIKPGKIIIIAGGTGLFPFCDLIDLLFKQQLMKMNPSATEQVRRLNPILEDDPFGRFQFQMFLAFNRVEEIHHISFQQLLLLGERGRIKVTFKLKEKVKGGVQGGNICFTSRPFQHLLNDLLQQRVQFSRILVCGPPKMNQILAAFFQSTRLNPDQYHFI